MMSLQSIIAYFILALALIYLVHKFIYPIPFLEVGKKNKPGCGAGDCGCN